VLLSLFVKLTNEHTKKEQTMLNRLAFRLTAEDAGYVATIERSLRTTTGAVFVSRSDVLRAALRVAAKATEGTA
jgi:hypothetical protein